MIADFETKTRVGGVCRKDYHRGNDGFVDRCMIGAGVASRAGPDARDDCRQALQKEGSAGRFGPALRAVGGLVSVFSEIEGCNCAAIRAAINVHFADALETQIVERICILEC